MTIFLLFACRAGEESATASDSPVDESPVDSEETAADSPAADSSVDSFPPCTGLRVEVGGSSLASGSTLDFGESPSLSSALQQQLRLQNPCADRLRFLGHPDSWLTGSAYSLAELPPVYLEPGEEATITLDYAPGAPGVDSGTFSLPHDQPEAPFVLALQATSGAPLRLVLVGDGGHIFSSADYGLTADHDSYDTVQAHTAALIRGVCASPDAWVAVGGNAERAWWASADGQSWDSGTEAGSPLADCAWFDGRFIASDGAPLWSADGRSWSRGSGSLPGHLRAMVAGDQGVVGVGDAGTIALTSDGESWLWSGQPQSGSLSRVVYGNGRYVAAGANGLTLASADGQSWVASTTGGSGVQGLIAVGDAYFLGDGRSLYRSEDGVSWDTVNATGVAPMAGLNGLLLGVYGLGIYRSEDEGFSWELGVESPAGLGFLDGVLEVGR